MPTGIELSAGILTGTNKPVDSKYGPYATTAAALADIPAALRYQGLTVGITTASGVVEYWFKAGVADSNFVEKTTGSGGVPAGALIISKTYAELKALKDANQLVPGQWYKITDFQLKWWNQSKNDVRVMTSSEVEPLNVFAIKSNEFAINAYSDVYPTDAIYYGFSANPLATPGSNYSAIPNAHGWITRRISAGITSIDAPYDWRHVTWNCCRCDLSSFPEWSPSATYSRREIVKYNNKLFISFNLGNKNNVPDTSRVDGNGDISDSTNIYWWAAVSPFVEGATYFPTDEMENTAFKLILPSKINFKLPWSESSTPPVAKYSPSYGLPQQNTWSINNYYPNQSDYVTIPWSQDRTQKPTFARNPTGIDSQNYFSGPVKMGAECIGNVFYKRAASVEFETNCKFNIFAGETYFLVAGNYFSFNRVGFSCYNNRFGNSCYSNSFGNASTRNTLGEDCNFNIFQSGTNNNNIAGTFRNNVLGNSFQNNSIDLLFLSNFCTFGFSTNKVGIGAIGNFFKIGSGNNIFDGNVANNDNYFVNCKIGNGFNNNTGNISSSIINGANKCVFPTNAPFDSNVCTNLLCCEFSLYVLNNKLDSVSYLTSTSTFTFNNISSMTRGVFGYWFRMNTIEPNVYNNIDADIVFTNATLTPNDAFNKRIFKNSSGQPRLSYHNAADQLVVTSPTA